MYALHLSTTDYIYKVKLKKKLVNHITMLRHCFDHAQNCRGFECGTRCIKKEIAGQSHVSEYDRGVGRMSSLHLPILECCKIYYCEVGVLGEPTRFFSNLELEDKIRGSHGRGPRKTDRPQ